MWLMIIGVPGVDDAYKQANQEAKGKFRNTEITRGHMNPSGINSFDINFMKATFTLTNAVPQFEAPNSGPWQVFENKMKDYAKINCGGQTRQGTLYLLTGRSENGLNAVPKPQVTNTFTVGQRRVKLETPAAVWTAGCCVWKEPGRIFGNLWKTKKAESFAVMSNNHHNKTQLNQTQTSVIDLEKRLKAAASATNVHLFPGNTKCARNNKIL